MNTSVYYKSDDILSQVLPAVDDLEYHKFPKGFYISLIQKALEGLGLATFFDERRDSFDFPVDTLTLPLPGGCFNVRNVYLFNGNECNIANAINVWWKKDYFTKGNGYIASDTGRNFLDPFYDNHANAGGNGWDKSLIRWDPHTGPRYFYNIQMGNVMFSSFCRGAANKVMIHYNGTGCDIAGVPIIPVFLREAVEDFVTEKVLVRMMAKDRSWKDLWAIYNNKLRQPYEGSWDKAETMVKSLNTSQRNNMNEYLSRGNWATGF